MSLACIDDGVRRGEDSEVGAETGAVITPDGRALAMTGMEETKLLEKKNMASMKGRVTPSGGSSSINIKFRWERRMQKVQKRN